MPVDQRDDFLRRSLAAAPKWPRWIEWLAACFALVFVAFGLGLFGDRPYILFAAAWILFAACFLKIRKAAPQFPEFGVVCGWFFLAVMAVGIAYMILHPEARNVRRSSLPHVTLHTSATSSP
jgi:hypothetical protein